MSEPLAYVRFTDGIDRPVFEYQGKQYVEGDDGEPVFGVWWIPPDDCYRVDEPVVIGRGPA